MMAFCRENQRVAVVESQTLFRRSGYMKFLKWVLSQVRFQYITAFPIETIEMSLVEAVAWFLLAFARIRCWSDILVSRQ